MAVAGRRLELRRSRHDGGLVVPGDGHSCARTVGVRAALRKRLCAGSGSARVGTAVGAPAAVASPGRAAIGPDWGGRVDRIHFPIQFYDVLFALEIMAEVGRIGDGRCADAFRLLESKRLPDGGFPLEEANATRADKVVSRGSFTGWGPTGRRRGSPLVSLAGAREATAGVGSPEPEPGTYQALMRTGVIRTGTENSRAVSASSISQCASGAWYLAA